MLAAWAAVMQINSSTPTQSATPERVFVIAFESFACWSLHAHMKSWHQTPVGAIGKPSTVRLLAPSQVPESNEVVVFPPPGALSNSPPKEICGVIKVKLRASSATNPS